jgi:hypothetical protein
MYRKHLKEMENLDSKDSLTKSDEIKSTGIKTIDRLADIPIVNTALANVTDYYVRVKDKNCLWRTSLNLAEMSFKTMAFAATPLTSLAKKPILSVDSYLCEKVDELEHNYPSINKPTEQLTANAYTQAKEVYDKTLKQPIDTLSNIKEKTVAYGNDTMNSLVKKGTCSIDSVRLYSYEKMHDTADLGIRCADSMLENKYAKWFTKPALDLYEKSLQYLIPLQQNGDSSALSAAAAGGGDSNTLKRIYDINSRVYKHLYQTTFAQLSVLHLQFENTIKKLQAIRDVLEFGYTDSKERINSAFANVSKNTLVSHCVAFIDKNKISLEKMDGIAKVYSHTVLNEIKQMVDKYMGLVKNFPVVFNGSKLKQSLETLMSQVNKESFGTFLSSTIDQLKKMNQTLMAYTTQMFQVVSSSNVATVDNERPSTEVTEFVQSIPAAVNTSASSNSNSRTKQPYN